MFLSGKMSYNKCSIVTTTTTMFSYLFL